MLITLFAGVWVDRRPRRPILVWTDFGRAALLATVPLAAWLGWLRIEQLYVVGFLVGLLIVLFSVAYQSYVPLHRSTTDHLISSRCQSAPARLMTL